MPKTKTPDPEKKNKAEAPEEAVVAETFGETTAVSEDVSSEEAITGGTSSNETESDDTSLKTPETKPKRKISAKVRKLNPEDLTEEELDYIFERRRTYTIDGAQRGEYYHGDNEITYFGEKATGGEKRSEKDEAIILTAAARTIPPEILTGTVVGYTETETKQIPMVQVELEGSAGFNQIRIPLNHFFVYDKKSFEGKDGHRRLQTYVGAYFGAKIRFCVFEYNEKEHLAYGSRLKAMEIISKYYYRTLNKRGDARIEVGSAVNATVIAAYKDRVVVDACGVDITLRSRDLSWLPIGYVYEDFPVGMSFPVKITEISAPIKVEAGSQVYTTHTVTASRKELTTDPSLMYFGRYKSGDIVQGVIKGENGSNGIFVVLQGHVSALCDTVPGNPPLNSTCRVMIVNKYEDTHQIRGSIVPGTIRPPKAAY